VVLIEREKKEKDFKRRETTKTRERKKNTCLYVNLMEREEREKV